MASRNGVDAEASWRLPPEKIVLCKDEIHVWRTSLNQSESRVNTLKKTLSADESERAERYRFEIDRKHFIVCRGVLRILLGRYLNTGPDEIRFRYGPNGKPSLVARSAGDAIRFNVSHSRGLALLVFAKGREVGIDLEKIDPDTTYESIAPRFFSSLENEMLRSLAEDARRDAFFHCWTRKEAYIKARGDGLVIPLDQFDVSLIPGEPASLLGSRFDTAEVSRWCLRELYPGSGFAAAVAVEGHGWRLKLWQWQQVNQKS